MRQRRMRRGSGLVVRNRFDIFKVRVLVNQIYKFDFKFEHKKSRHSIFSLDEAKMSRTRAYTSSM